MKIAVCSDECQSINQFVIEELEARGHEVVRFGALKTGHEVCWAKTAKDAALAIVNQECDEGIFFCYTATGVTMVANKIAGIRAALCVDADTAKNARMWNHANVLALSNRLLSEQIAREILSAWFSTPPDERGSSSVRELTMIDEEFRRRP